MEETKVIKWSNEREIEGLLIKYFEDLKPNDKKEISFITKKIPFKIKIKLGSEKQLKERHKNAILITISEEPGRDTSISLTKSLKHIRKTMDGWDLKDAVIKETIEKVIKILSKIKANLLTAKYKES